MNHPLDMTPRLSDRGTMIPSRLANIIFVMLIQIVGTAACGGVQRPYYGVDAIELVGTDEMAAESIRNCLLTRERSRFEITLGIANRTCNQPPFDSEVPRIRLWNWPWTDWTIFNPAVLDQDLERIRRWYRARGYYQTKIIDLQVTPVWAYAPDVQRPKGACDPGLEDCAAQIVIAIAEGKPLRVKHVELSGHEQLYATVRKRLEEHEALPVAGDRFDESLHDRAKAALLAELRHASYAGATVSGEIHLNVSHGSVDLRYRIDPGPAYRFGVLKVKGARKVPIGPIVAVVGLRQGRRYDDRVLPEVQKEVTSLGAFSAVEVEQTLHPDRKVVDLLVKVSEVKPLAFRVGVGVASGQLRRTETGELNSIPQWDVHLFGMVERRHVLFGLGKMRVEDKPRMIFNQSFPGIEPPRFGNWIRVSLDQMGLLERRTDLFNSVQHDYGPDPFLAFFRHDFILRLGLRRPFLDRQLFATFAVQQDLYEVERGQQTSDGSPLPSSYLYSFVEQDLRLDLRDDSLFPTRGAYFGLNAAANPRWAGSDWFSIRLAPEARGYLSLPLSMVLAGRAALALNHFAHPNPDLDGPSVQLGPHAYRLRGGGASSNRGFLAGRLGAGVQGGLRRWELSIELRIRLGQSVVLVVFSDLGDVNDAPRFRFRHLNTSIGWGLRFLTPIVPIRFDVGHRIEALKGEASIEADAGKLPLVGGLGAVHLTIGEAF